MSAVKEDVKLDTKVVFELSPKLDIGKLRKNFQRDGRFRIADFLPPRTALELYKHLANDIEWQPFVLAKEKWLTAPPRHADRYPPELEAKMLATAYEGIRCGFANAYEANRLLPGEIPEEVASLPCSPRTGLLQQLSDFLDSPGFLTLMRSVTGETRISRTEVHATRHRPGHFTAAQTSRSSPDESTEPVATLTLALTIEWRPEWGGLLEIPTRESLVVTGLVPSFNTLDVFVPAKEFRIGMVAPFATGERLAVTGYLYADEP